MAQHGGESFHIHTVLQSQRREGVPQVMKPHLLAPGVFQDELEPFAHHARGEGTILLHRRREHPSGVHRFLVLLQHLDHRWRQYDFANGILGLRLAELKFSIDLIDLLVHIQHARFEVQVVPLECHELTTPQAGGKVQEEEFVVALGLGLDEEALKFVPVQHLHLPRPLGRQLTADGRVGANEPILHRLLQRGAAGGMAHTHHPVGQSLTEAFREGLPAILFEPCIELLQVVLGQLVQRDVTDLRDDMQTDAALIAQLGGGADLGFGVSFIPVLQPVTEPHVGLHLVGLDAAQLLFQFLELFGTLPFGFGEDILRLGIALVIVADDIASLPTSVRPLSYGSVSVFSFSCHGFNSFPKRSSMKLPTIPLACCCMSEVTWV